MMKIKNGIYNIKTLQYMLLNCMNMTKEEKMQVQNLIYRYKKGELNTATLFDYNFEVQNKNKIKIWKNA